MKRPAAILGGVMEDDGVAATAALYDALTNETLTPEQEYALRYWRSDVLLLLVDLEVHPTDAEVLYDDLLNRRSELKIKDEHPVLVELVGDVLQANIDLVRASI
jgi:hypothetical protein